MVKYIIKRLLLSLLIVVGVSVIIYVLIRLMPMDYVDQKFQSQLSQGTVQKEDIERIKEGYGLQVKYRDYAVGYGWIGRTGLKYDEEGNIVDTNNDKSTLDEGILIDASGVALSEKYKDNKSLSENDWVQRELSGGQEAICKIRSFFEGYGTWLINALHGDFGQSFKFGDDVGTIIGRQMWISFAISLVALVLQFIIAIPLGVQAATHQYGAMDYTVTVLAMMGISLPTFFFGALVLGLFSLKLGWFPYQGLNDSSLINPTWITHFLDTVHHLVLPIVTLVILSIGGLMRYTRTNMLEVLSADYIRTARAKGCSEKTVIYRHAFRNTLIPVVTMLAGIIPSLFGGAMITEQVFALPGIGNSAYQALIIGDVPFVMAYNLFLAVLSVLGTLLSDLMYAVVDPRVKITK